MVIEQSGQEGVRVTAVTPVGRSDRAIIDAIRNLSGDQRDDLLRNLQGSLTPEEINILLGRKQGLADFDEKMRLGEWSELEWQNYFEREQ